MKMNYLFIGVRVDVASLGIQNVHRASKPRTIDRVRSEFVLRRETNKRARLERAARELS